MTATWSGTPKTWATGELVTASDLNTELRDRMDYLKVSIISGNYIHIRDEKASGTNAGTFTSGAWQTRDLNTEVSDAGGYASLGSNQITLAAGTYLIQASAPVLAVNQHRLRLQNITDGTTELLGTVLHASGSNLVGNLAVLNGVFTLATSKVLELQHRCALTRATDGFGSATSFGGNEVYAVVELIRIGD